ncbi:adenylosuccinate synthetase [Chryseobacterium flavum]|uniref:adenylosuccinate synthetase n=1 Tax=Chryseobacterium flavum TaxID=415851 RepID=UPI0028AB0FEE|nr:adenylosuccinate synthetase [Chryseobacterium flavum]
MAERKIILVLSGEICTGKSTLACNLAERFGFQHCKTIEGLKEIGNKRLNNKIPDRDFWQNLGNELDAKQGGRWVLDYFQQLFAKNFQNFNYYVIDSARTLKQIQHIRTAFGYAVYHIHLDATPAILKKRFFDRGEIKELTKSEQQDKYQRYKSDETEKKVNELRDSADLVIDTDRCNDQDIFIRVSSYLRLLTSTNNDLVDVIIGGQFGSEGKGQIAAHIAPEYDCLMRVGGPNAGHSVYEEPAAHVFHLLPSGTHRAPQAKLLIGPGAILNISKILEEIQTYNIETGRLVIDENAVIISSEDIKKETELQHHIGSTAQGVGVATAGNVLARLLGDDKHKAKNFYKELRPFLGSTHDELEKMFNQNKRVLLEGTQGTGLSLQHGLYPYVTSRDTTVSGCLSEAGISPFRVRKTIMVTRTYPIRVAGNSGPFLSQELDMDTIAHRSGKNAEELKKKEKTTTTKRDRRIGEFSWQMFRKACELNSPTDIALTFVDYHSVKNTNVRRYNDLTEETRNFIEEIESCSGANVSLIGTAFDYRAVIDRRNWK